MRPVLPPQKYGRTRNRTQINDRNTGGTIMQYITEQEIERITSDTCAALAKEKKVCLRIEAAHGEAYWEGGINGHFFRIRTGEPVEVPESLARLIADSAKTERLAKKRVSAYASGGGKRVG